MNKRPATQTTIRSRSLMTLNAQLRTGSGVHADQNKRTNTKRSRTNSRQALRTGNYDHA